jgi:hypothetical protein
MQYAATFVDSTLFGPASGTNTGITVPIAPTAGGELLVVTITNSAGAYGWVRMTGGTSEFQVGAGPLPCGKYVAIFTLGNIEPGVSSLTIETEYQQPPPAFAVLVTRFAGLAPDTGATFSYDYGDPTAACPGTVVASAVTSCGEVSLLPESPFVARTLVDGVAAAYYIPTDAGRFTADWQATDTMYSTIVSLD